jgi:hypothetical protein
MMNLNMYFIFGVSIFCVTREFEYILCMMFEFCPWFIIPYIENLVWLCFIRQAKDVVKGIKKKIGSRNSKVQLLALTVSEGVH